MSCPVAVVHVPHASTVVPDDIRASFFLSDQELDDELLLQSKKAGFSDFQVARLVMEETPHVMLVGEGAAKFVNGVLRSAAREQEGGRIAPPPEPAAAAGNEAEICRQLVQFSPPAWYWSIVRKTASSSWNGN